MTTTLLTPPPPRPPLPPPGPGPARELHGGSGHGSQDSATLVLATPQPPAQITVRWPGGRETTGPVPPGAREIRVDETGKVEKLR